VRTRVSHLSASQEMVVEIAKVVAVAPNVLISRPVDQASAS
jgi:hypothetical protein